MSRLAHRRPLLAAQLAGRGVPKSVPSAGRFGVTPGFRASQRINGLAALSCLEAPLDGT